MTASKRPPKKTETLEVRMPHETKRAFLDACRKEGRTASEVVRGFVESYLQRAALRERLRERLPSQRSLAMILRSKSARRGLVAAALGALGLFAAVTPSAAEVDFRAMFETMDADRDGRVSLAEFSDQEPRDDVTVLVNTARTVDRDGVLEERAAEIWLPSPPSPDAKAVGGIAREELRVTRLLENGEVLTEEIERREMDDATLMGLRQLEFERFDSDGDGGVDFTEFETRHMALITDTFRVLDADGDGRISGAEAENAQTALGLHMRLPLSIEPSPAARESFAALDRDGDGGVTLEEFAAGPA